MEDFRIIYRILKYLDESMDFEDFDSDGFTAERFGTNTNRFEALLVQLAEGGYLSGITITHFIRSSSRITAPLRPRITLKGLEYLNENSMMQKAAKLAKGVLDVLT